jgi:hypothetical protein
MYSELAKQGLTYRHLCLRHTVFPHGLSEALSERKSLLLTWDQSREAPGVRVTAEMVFIWVFSLGSLTCLTFVNSRLTD